MLHSVPGTRTQQNKPAHKNKKNENQEDKQPTGVLKNVMQEDQNGCKKNNIHAEEEQITAGRTKQRDEEEEDTGIRPAGRENTGTMTEKRQTKEEQNKQARLVSLLPLSRSPNEK